MEHRIDARASQESVDQRLARIAESRHGVLSRAQAMAAGATRGLIQTRVTTGRWEALYLGVYRLAGAPRSWRQDLLAACLAAGDGAVASHRAAAALWRYPGIDEGYIEISVPRHRRVQLPRLLVHQAGALAAVDITRFEAIPLTTPCRTLIDVAAVVPADALEEALDDALRRRLVTLSRLKRRLAELGQRGRPGIRAISAMLQARAGTREMPESVLETRLLRLIKRAGLPLPACQHPVRVRGRLIAVVDFAYPSVRFAVEADGYRWHSGRVRWDRDLARRNELTALGWRLIHVTSTNIRQEPDKIVGMIARELARA